MIFMKNFMPSSRFLCLLPLLEMMVACTTSLSSMPLQRLSEAQAAIDAAKSLATCSCPKYLTPPCLCPDLAEAEAAYQRAQKLIQQGRYRAAEIAAESALHSAQNVIRQQKNE